MLETFEASLTDTSLTELHAETALVDARIAQLLRSVGEGNSSAAWREAVFAFRGYKRAILKRDKPAADDSLTRLENILEREGETHRAWEEVTGLVSLRRQLSESQTKREVLIGRYIEASKVKILLTALTDAVQVEVRSPATLQAIGLRFEKILSGFDAVTLPPPT
jgi:hypothetical protein